MLSCVNRISRTVAKYRFKFFRLISIIVLGRNSGQSIIGDCVSYDLEFSNKKSVRDRILQRIFLSEPSVQKYRHFNVPDCWRTMYSRPTVFPKRYAYVLHDVVIGPETGVVYAPSSGYFSSDGIIFAPSIGNQYYLFCGAIQEVMCRFKVMDDIEPIYTLPTLGYYHLMFEGLIRVIIARRIFGNIKILIAMNRSRILDEMLEFIGIDRSRIIVSECPVQVQKGILIPRWIDSGENLREDVCEFRDALVAKLPSTNNEPKKLYISRAKSRRALQNEHEIEELLRSHGFAIAYFEDIPFVEQLMAIRGAETIVAPHGAGLSNLIVARSGTRVVEIMTQAWANSCFGHLSSSLGLDYSCVDAADIRLMDILNEL